MITRLVLIGVLATAAGCEAAHTAESDGPPQVRVRSTNGFSFLPPPGGDWTEEFTGCQIHYSKKTDPRKVSFFAFAHDCKLDAPLTSKEEIVAFVRKKKDEWGTDGRYANISSSVMPEAANPSCVRYRMEVQDHGASNRGSHPFLLMKVIGRFCTHRQSPNSAVDLAYSIRHVPGFVDTGYRAEGEAFLDSLRLEAPIGQPSAGR